MWYGLRPTRRWVTNSELVILIGAVDNNKSRKLCHEVFLRARDLVYIDSGNGEYTGQIVCGIRRAGKTVYKPVGMLYPEVSDPGRSCSPRTGLLSRRRRSPPRRPSWQT